MKRYVVSTLGAAALVALVLASCNKQQKGPVAAEGHKICKYCCSTARIECSCELLDVVECPAADQTGKLPACAECRNCTEQIKPEESCSAE